MIYIYIHVYIICIYTHYVLQCCNPGGGVVGPSTHVRHAHALLLLYPTVAYDYTGPYHSGRGTNREHETTNIYI